MHMHMSTGKRMTIALFALAAMALVTSGWALDPRAVEGPEAKSETKEPAKPPESTPSQVPETQQEPPGQTQPAPAPSPEEKERQAQEEAKARKRAEVEAAAEAEEAGANAKAPKRFIPSTPTKADSSVTFPVDI